MQDVDTNRAFFEDLFSNDEEKCFQAIIQLKSALIGSNKAKNRVIEAGVVPRLLNLLTEPTVTHPDLKVSVAYALGKNIFNNFCMIKYPDRTNKQVH